MHRHQERIDHQPPGHANRPELNRRYKKTFTFVVFSPLAYLIIQKCHPSFPDSVILVHLQSSSIYPVVVYGRPFSTARLNDTRWWWWCCCVKEENITKDNFLFFESYGRWRRQWVWDLKRKKDIKDLVWSSRHRRRRLHRPICRSIRGQNRIPAQRSRNSTWEEQFGGFIPRSSCPVPLRWLAPCFVCP